MKNVFFALLLLAPANLFALPPTEVSNESNPIRWVSQPPADCPFPASEEITSITFTGRYARYTAADTWYPSWAEDGNLYSPFADGTAGEFFTMWTEKTTGQARIEGDNPLNLDVIPLGLVKANPKPYAGLYPCGTLIKDGIWYYGYYALTELDWMNWTVQGPFVGFRISRDKGQTWSMPPHTAAKPIFGEHGAKDKYLKIGAPHFVDFGRNMGHSPDGYAYMVAHGAELPDPKPRPVNLNWIVADQIYMLRVKPSLETINDPAAWEFFAGHNDSGDPVWTSGFSRIRPLLEWNNNMGCVTMTFNPKLEKYLMCVTDGRETIHSMNTYLLESDSLTGPFRLVTYMKDFGPQAYFVNIPSKFISGDGRTAWLCYSANFTPQKLPVNPPGSGYGMTLQEIVFGK
jgi:hypothetical protein